MHCLIATNMNTCSPVAPGKTQELTVKVEEVIVLEKMKMKNIFFILSYLLFLTRCQSRASGCP